LASAAQGTGLSNYSITYAPGTLTINKLGITLSGNVTYTGSSIVDGSGLTITNLVSGTSSTITGSIAIASADVGSQSIVNFGGLSLSNSNYTVTGASGSVNVTPAPLGISATGVYTGTTTILPTNYVLTGLVGSDVNATLVSFVVNNKNVASATRVTGMTLGGALASNYEINSSANSTPSTTTTNTVSLTRAALTITAVNDAKFVTQTDTQGSSSNCNPSPCVGGYAGLLVNGLLAGETITVLSSSPTITRTNASVNSHGEYLGVLMPTGFSSSNYNLSYVAGNYTIVPADTLLVKVAAVTATYGSSPNYSGKVTAQYLRSGNILVDLTPGISNSDISVDDGAGTTANFTLRGLGVTTSSSGKANVGQFNIEASNTIVNGTNFSNNLVVTGSLKINPLTLTANNLVSGVSKTYDGNDRVTNIPLNISGSGVLTNDVIGVTGLGRFSATSNVGSSLAVNIDLSLTGADKGNYALDTSTLNANIGQINQLNSVTYVGQTGGSWSDAANWAGGAIPTLSNVANVVIPSGVSVKYDHVSLGANAPASGVLFENNGVLVINESSNYTLSNNISGAGSVTQSGTGLLTMSGNNTFTGGINITNKSIILGSANALGAGSVTSSGGTLGVSSGVTLPRLTVNGPVTLSSDITTSGSQIYNGTVSLGRTLTLDAGVNNVTFNDSVGHVGISYANYVAQHGSNNVYNLTVLADTVNINADITTYGTQTYGRDNALTKVVIGGVGSPCLLGGVGNCRILISEDPAITVWGTVNDSVVNTHDLVLKSVAYSTNENPTVDLKGNVGDLKSLKSLTVSTGMQESAGSPQFADISQSQYRGNITLLGDVTTLNNQEYTANQITVGANSLAEEYTFTSTEGRVIFNTGASNVPPTVATGSSYRIADTYTSNLSNQSTGGGGISSALILSEIHRFGLAANDVSIDQRKVGNGGSSMEIVCVNYDDNGNCRFDD
jgi:autotransporter-associated beta strand protein